METTTTLVRLGGERTTLLTFFRLPGETLGEFASQIKQLSNEEKDELAKGVEQLIVEKRVVIIER